MNTWYEASVKLVRIFEKTNLFDKTAINAQLSALENRKKKDAKKAAVSSLKSVLPNSKK